MICTFAKSYKNASLIYKIDKAFLNLRSFKIDLDRSSREIMSFTKKIFGPQFSKVPNINTNIIITFISENFEQQIISYWCDQLISNFIIFHYLSAL